MSFKLLSPKLSPVLSKALMGFLATSVLSTAAYAAPADFVGTWVNMNPASRGLIRVVVSPGMQMRAFGSCTPTPCDWGSVPMVTYGSSVSDSDHKAASAHFGFSFKRVGVIAKMQAGKRTMVVEDFNQFTDGSGRQNYFMIQRFRKAGISEVSENFKSEAKEPVE